MCGQYVVSGYITNSLREPIIGAHVITNQDDLVVTNEYGFYALHIGAGPIELTVTHIGYEARRLKLYVAADTLLDVALQDLTLEAVEVTSSIATDKRNRVQLGHLTLPVSTLRAVPSLMGQQDVIRALTILPGVNAGLEASSGLYIRGGTPDQNLLLLDGAPVYNVSHLYGLFTVFNPDVVKNVELYKSSIPAHYGDRLSSVVSINMKEGNLERWEKKYSMGLIGSSFAFDGPLKKERTGILLSGRASYLSLISLPFRIAYEVSPSFDVFGDYNMYDINAKLNHIVNEKERLFINFYAGNDHQVGLSSTLEQGNRGQNAMGYNWGNITFSVRRTKQPKRAWFVQDQLVYTRFKTNLFARQNTTVNLDRQVFVTKRLSFLHEYAYTKQLSHWTAGGHWFKGGLELSYRKAVPIQTISRSTFPNLNVPSKEQRIVVHGLKAALYVGDNWEINEQVVLDLGLRYQFYSTSNRDYHSLEPRVNLGFSLTDQLVFSATYARTSQSIHGLTGVNSNLPIQGWVNASDRTPIQRADLLSAGFGYKTPALDMRLDGYHRWLYKQLDFKQGSGILTGFNTDYEDLVERGGQGWAYGVELYLERRKRLVNMILSYALSWNQRQFENLSFGEKYFHQYDQRHTLTAFLNWTVTKKWDLSALFQYNTGRRQTLPVSAYRHPNGSRDIFYAPDRNNFIMPDYHRLDISASKHWVSKKNQKKKSLTFSLYNAYFRKNVSYYRFDQVQLPGNDRIKNKLRQVTILPLIPSLTYTVDLSSGNVRR